MHLRHACSPLRVHPTLHTEQSGMSGSVPWQQGDFSCLHCTTSSLQQLDAFLTAAANMSELLLLLVVVLVVVLVVLLLRSELSMSLVPTTAPVIITMQLVLRSRSGSPRHLFLVGHLSKSGNSRIFSSGSLLSTGSGCSPLLY